MNEISMQLICIGCPNSCELHVSGSREAPQIEGNRCGRGKEFALSELNCPMRSLTTTVRLIGGETPMLPVRTEADIPKAKISQAMKEISKIKIAAPVSCGDTVAENIAGTGVKLIATAGRKRGYER